MYSRHSPLKTNVPPLPQKNPAPTLILRPATRRCGNPCQNGSKRTLELQTAANRGKQTIHKHLHYNNLHWLLARQLDTGTCFATSFVSDLHCMSVSFSGESRCDRRPSRARCELGRDSRRNPVS